MAQVVYDGVSPDAAVQGYLFRGMKFWFSTKVPLRTYMIQQVKDNGGEIVDLDKLADVKIVDHAKKGNHAGTHSYQYIEKSIRNGVLEDLDDHRAGPPAGTVRPVGAIDHPTSHGRRPYTAEDDRALRDWVADKAVNGAAIRGNEIYKQLERINPRHPWQSWRDRYIKHLMPLVPHNAPPTPPTDQAEENTTELVSPEQPSQPPNEQSVTRAMTGFTSEDAKALDEYGDGILDMNPEKATEAWEQWGAWYPNHSAQEWRAFWETIVRPVYLEKKAYEARHQRKAVIPGEKKAPVASTNGDSDTEGPRPNTPSKQTTLINSPVRSPLQELPLPPASVNEDEATSSSSTSKQSSMVLNTTMNFEERTPKRKGHALAHELLRSTSPDDYRSPFPKRRRMEQAEAKPSMEQAESRFSKIPSTPEEIPPVEHLSTIGAEAVDLSGVKENHETSDDENDEASVVEEIPETSDDENYEASVTKEIPETSDDESDKPEHGKTVKDLLEDEYEDEDQVQSSPREPSPSLSEPLPSARKTSTEPKAPNRHPDFVQVSPSSSSAFEDIEDEEVEYKPMATGALSLSVQKNTHTRKPSNSGSLDDGDEDEKGADDDGTTPKRDLAPFARNRKLASKPSNTYFLDDHDKENEVDTADSVEPCTLTRVFRRNSHAGATTSVIEKPKSAVIEVDDVGFFLKKAPSVLDHDLLDDQDDQDDVDEDDDPQESTPTFSHRSVKRTQQPIIEVPVSDHSAASDEGKESDDESAALPASPRDVRQAAFLLRRPSAHSRSFLHPITNNSTSKPSSTANVKDHEQRSVHDIHSSNGIDVSDEEDGDENPYERPPSRTFSGITRKDVQVGSMQLKSPTVHTRTIAPSPPTSSIRKAAPKLEIEKTQRLSIRDLSTSESGSDEEEEEVESAFERAQARPSPRTARKVFQGESSRASSSRPEDKMSSRSTPSDATALPRTSPQTVRKTIRAVDTHPPSRPQPPASSSSYPPGHAYSPPTDPDLIPVDRWYTTQLKSGVDIDTIARALHAGMGDVQLAEIVLRSLKKGNGIPKNVRGIWTEEDDECVERGDGRDLKRVIEKHGKQSIAERRIQLSLSKI